jgi:hypothetical protein
MVALSSAARERPGFHKWYSVARDSRAPMLMVWALWN